MILMSTGKLKTPLRRLIFGVSVSDAISSISNVFQPLMLPDGVMSYGNQGTCEAVAFSFHFGTFASPLYTLALCIYYLQVIRYNTSDRDFAKRIEPWLHFLAIAFPLLGCIVNLAVGNFNSNGIICWINPEPYNCVDSPDVDCMRGENFKFYALVFASPPGTVSFVGIVYIMAVISWTVIEQERRTARRRFQVQQTRNGGRNNRLSITLRLRNIVADVFSRGTREAGDSNSNNIPIYETLGARAAQNRVREAVTQSLLYIAAFIITYTGFIAICILLAVNATVPFPLMQEWAIFVPLAGFFNIFVYTRLKVSTVRRRRPEYWWFQAFWMVVKAGGDMPDIPRRQRTDIIAPGFHTDVSAMRRRLAALAQPVSSIRDEEINEVSEPPNSTKQLDRGVTFHADDNMVEAQELALVRSGEEEFAIDEGPATVERLTQQIPPNYPPGDSLDESYSSCEAAVTIETLSTGGDIP